MKTDTTLFEVYSQLGLLDAMQTDEGRAFVNEQLNHVQDEKLAA